MLNGSLDTVPLPDVLRLIASSGKSGLLGIHDASPSGRIFVIDGRVAFATTRNEDDPIENLLQMEYRADSFGSADDRRIVNLNDLLDSNPEAFNRFLEQMVVEVLSRLLRVDQGQFRFDVDVLPRREIPHSFDTEDMIEQASARAEAWARIFEIVPSTTDAFRMAPRLEPTDDVVLARRDWALLSATGAASTITDISQKLKIFEFAAAKKVAELAQRGLVEFVRTEVPETSMAATGLLSEVVETEVLTTESLGSQLAPSEGLETTAEEIRLERFDEPEPIASAEEAPDSGVPTWLPVEGGDIDEDGAPLLEELHRLHEAEAAEPQQPDGVEEDPEPREDGDVDAEPPEDGDLATRWKNLRKAKRDVHAGQD